MDTDFISISQVDAFVAGGGEERENRLGSTTKTVGRVHLKGILSVIVTIGSCTGNGILANSELATLDYF